jgi:hypothetical protein
MALAQVRAYMAWLRRILRAVDRSQRHNDTLGRRILVLGREQAAAAPRLHIVAGP